MLNQTLRNMESETKDKLRLAVAARGWPGRVFAFDWPAAVVDAVVDADLAARRGREGQALPMEDAQIAATCLAHGAQLAKHHVRHFEGLGLVWVYPWLA